MDHLSATWRKSTYSGGNGGNCIEVTGNLTDAIAVRDSKDPAGPTLTFGSQSWESFTTAIKAGQYDLA